MRILVSLRRQYPLKRKCRCTKMTTCPFQCWYMLAVSIPNPHPPLPSYCRRATCAHSYVHEPGSAGRHRIYIATSLDYRYGGKGRLRESEKKATGIYIDQLNGHYIHFLETPIRWEHTSSISNSGKISSRWVSQPACYPVEEHIRVPDLLSITSTEHAWITDVLTRTLQTSC